MVRQKNNILVFPSNKPYPNKFFLKKNPTLKFYSTSSTPSEQKTSVKRKFFEKKKNKKKIKKKMKRKFFGKKKQNFISDHYWAQTIF